MTHLLALRIAVAWCAPPRKGRTPSLWAQLVLHLRIPQSFAQLKPTWLLNIAEHPMRKHNCLALQVCNLVLDMLNLYHLARFHQKEVWPSLPYEFHVRTGGKVGGHLLKFVQVIDLHHSQGKSHVKPLPASHHKQGRLTCSDLSCASEVMINEPIYIVWYQ